MRREKNMPDNTMTARPHWLCCGMGRRIELQLLMNLTARALGKPARRTWTLSNDDALRVYAEYTRDHLSAGVDDAVLQRMAAEACKVGRRLRRVLFLRRQHDIERLTVALYRNIGITLEGHLPGALCFRKCFFSRYYTPELCLAASALDEGLMRGLSGGGELRFRQRITEGCATCIATFSSPNDQTTKHPNN